MKIIITDDLGKPLCETLHEMQEEINGSYKLSKTMIHDVYKTIEDQKKEISQLKDQFIELQNESIKNNNTIWDVLKNTFTKKKTSNISHSTVEIND